MNERGECASAPASPPLRRATDRRDSTTSTTTTNDTTDQLINTQHAVSGCKDAGPENGPTDGVHLTAPACRKEKVNKAGNGEDGQDARGEVLVFAAAEGGCMRG